MSIQVEATEFKVDELLIFPGIGSVRIKRVADKAVLVKLILHNYTTHRVLTEWIPVSLIQVVKTVTSDASGDLSNPVHDCRQLPEWFLKKSHLSAAL